MPLSEVVGNAGVVSRLARGIRSGRLPPSMLFSGPSGVGKLRTALSSSSVTPPTSQLRHSPSGWGAVAALMDGSACPESAARRSRTTSVPAARSPTRWFLPVTRMLMIPTR